MPNESGDYAVPADEAQRSAEEARRQELAVAFSIATGRPVTFTNSNGQTEQVSVRKDGEDFAESWLAYVEARERGPEALAAFEAKYPNRAAILEQVYEGTWEG